MPERRRKRRRLPRALAAQAVDVEDLRFLAQARDWIGFILIDFWSFCAMRTDCRMFACPMPFSPSGAKRIKHGEHC